MYVVLTKKEKEEEVLRRGRERQQREILEREQITQQRQTEATLASSKQAFAVIAIVLFYGFVAYLFVAGFLGGQKDYSVKVNCTTDACHEYYGQKLYEQGQDNSRPDYLDVQGL